MRKSWIAENIMSEYKRKKRYKETVERQKTTKFIKENCMNCKNKSTNKCDIRRNINNELQCIYKEI